MINPAKVSPSRKNMFSVMQGAGFGKLTVHTPEGASIVYEQKHLTKDGSVKKHIERHTKELTRENIEILEGKGVRLFVGGVKL